MHLEVHYSLLSFQTLNPISFRCSCKIRGLVLAQIVESRFFSHIRSWVWFRPEALISIQSFCSHCKMIDAEDIVITWVIHSWPRFSFRHKPCRIPTDIRISESSYYAFSSNPWILCTLVKVLQYLLTPLWVDTCTQSLVDESLLSPASISSAQNRTKRRPRRRSKRRSEMWPLLQYDG